MVMVKRFLIHLIKIYQKMPLKTHNSCKFIPTCSNYAISVINDFGAIKGTFLSIKRILKCNPFTKGGIDLPPKKEIYEKN